MEGAEFRQGLFQELGRMYLFASAQGQVGIHAKVRTYAFTCSGQDFFGGIICQNIEPISANSITKDLDILNSPFPVAVLVERQPAFVELKGLRGASHSLKEIRTRPSSRR